MSDLSVALLAIFGTVASVTGVVLYVFNGTRNLLRKMDGTQEKMQETLSKVQETLAGVQETLRELTKLTRTIPERTAEALKS